ncbi:hypothetical protein C6Q28_07950 [Burkholderia multivorans]|nr:conserved hypothetical protein [Burkholderia multivorans ATCC 17616]PRF13134.1 hypothetical protein C6Q07_04375 [Burkholderia multivorans]PRF62998.1 hypothetical protein C6Q28_07950 [Burkholderia multivorans]
MRYRVTDARANSQENTALAVLLDAASTLVNAASSDCERLQTLKRFGHPRPRAVRRPPAQLPGQQDFFADSNELEQLADH